MIDLDINSFIANLRKKHFMKNTFLFIVGVFISAFAFNLFFLRYNIVTGGSTGFSLLLSNFIRIVPISLIILIINLFCLIIGLVFFGWEYAAKMLAVTFLYPFFVTISSYITGHINLDDTALSLIMVMGGGLTGFANGLVRNSGYSPGGFYAIYDLVNKYFHISIGTANAIINIVLIGFSGMFLGISKVVYAVISLLVSSYVIDRVTIGISDNKVFYIITDKPLEIKEYVNDMLHYDITVINARGGYSNKRKKVLMCVISTLEYVRLKEVVQEMDKNAFFLIVDTYESTVRKKCKNM